MTRILRINELCRYDCANESIGQSRNENTVECDGFEYKEDLNEFNPDDFGWTKEEIDGFYSKKNNILLAINDLNMVQRNHRVVVYDDEIAVYGINVPMLSDCRNIAKENDCDYKQENILDCFIFRLL